VLRSTLFNLFVFN